MQRYKVTITPQSPLCFSESRPGGQFRDSLPYIPGTALRAAVAERMLAGTSGAFADLFTGPQPAIFSNAYPAEYVLPATAMSCKANPGFMGGERQRHGVIDTLVEQVCFETLRPAGLLYLPHCRECGSRLEHYSCFYRFDGTKAQRVSVPQRLLTRVAINRRRGTAEEGLLYSPIVVAEGVRRPERNWEFEPTTFTGFAACDKHGNTLKKCLGEVDFLGSGTTRGLGRVKVEALEQSSSTDADLDKRCQELNERITTFSETLQKLPCSQNPTHSSDQGSYFTLDLYADAILKEDGWLPTMVLTAEMLKARCGIRDDTLQLVRAYSGYDYRGGWNLAWGLPKDVEVVVPRGSVFVYWTKSLDEWRSALQDLEFRGIGERPAEGFGQVRVCDEFHTIASRGRRV
ncbi:MAG TPA: CRISPR-associated RAMP protein Csx10 [Terriglobia bacterium]|nr:CRISPR-associated RAMP protein Csx10 [Terriglobia bacterium]